MAFKDDLDILRACLKSLKSEWDGKACVLELREADFHWRQMEWWAFYFEHLCNAEMCDEFQIPGERINRVTFDATRTVNWDIKAKAIRSDDHRAILNDCAAMGTSIERHGEHGVIIGLCDVEYNDEDRSFQKWHTELKGGLSKYEIERIARTQVSRYRKTSAILREILFLRIDADALLHLDVMHQGRNANGRPRPPKYMVHLERLDPFLADQIVLRE